MYTDITTVEKAFEKMGLNPNLRPDFSMFPEKYRQPFISHFELCIINEALNDDPAFPNWNAADEYKYFLWLDIEASDECPSGSGLSIHDVDFTFTSTAVGSRLSYKNAKMARFAFETFPEQHKNYYLKKA